MNVVLAILGAVLQIVGLILFQYYGWVVAVVVLGYLIWQNRRRRRWVSNFEHTVLKIEVPKDNDKKELSAEQMFASLHGILRPRKELIREGSLQEHVSFEIASVGNQIQFYVWVPTHLKDFVEGQIYAQYPSVQIREGAEDYARHELGDRAVLGTELTLAKAEVLPIKTFPSFEVDPIAGITATLAKLEEKGEEIWVQVMTRPVDDSWQDKGMKYIEDVKAGRNPNLWSGFVDTLVQLPIYILTNLLPALITPPGEGDKKTPEKKELSPGQTAMIKAVEEKITKLGYEVKIRIAYLGPNQQLAKQRLQALVGGFKQFNTTNLNGFRVARYSDDPEFLQEYRARLFLERGQTLNIEELASLYHLPHTNVETPSIVWTNHRTAEPPANLPSEHNTPSTDLSLFGLTNFRGKQIKFGMKREDRGRHLYIIGQTGTGKSMLLQLLTLSEIYHDHGFAVIDPHGDYATDIMKYIPKNRVKDVTYFNPADRQHPIAFNPLEMIDPDSRHHLTSELVGVLRRMFESWGPRLEHILRFTILALLHYPDSTMLGITRMLTDKEFRKRVVREIDDPVVRAFWVNEFASWNDKFQAEAVAPVLNKVGAFIANPLVRNIIGQPRSTINLRQMMDEGKILVVNLARGLVGEDNSAILGALMVTKMQLAAMSRANVPMSERRPFYLYVDEFQNFATDSFAVILSEARKYGLNLTVANQYISQMPDTVKDAVFGNVGSMITFRVGATDGLYLSKYFDPVFDNSDLVKLHNQHTLISMSIDGEKSGPFSATTLMMPEPVEDYSAEIIDLSRKRYALPRAEVEEKIANEDQVSPSGRPEPVADFEQKPNILRELRNPAKTNRPDRPRGRFPDRDQRPRGQDKPTERARQQEAPSLGKDTQNRPNSPNSDPTSTKMAGSGSNHSAVSQEINPEEVINLRQ